MIDMSNILQVIAAVAADNLMHNEITQVAIDKYQVVIVDGQGNALSEPFYSPGRVGVVNKAGVWFRNYRFGEWAVGQGGTGIGDGWAVGNFFSPMRRWERSQRYNY